MAGFATFPKTIKVRTRQDRALSQFTIDLETGSKDRIAEIVMVSTSNNINDMDFVYSVYGIF
jgi:hypothetical protein